MLLSEFVFICVRKNIDVCEGCGMKLFVRAGALATLNVLCCSNFALAADVGNNIKLQSNLSQNNVVNKTITQNITPSRLRVTNTEFANFLPSNAPLVAMLDTSSTSWRKAGDFQLFQTIWNGISFLIPPVVKNGYATDIEP